MVIRVVLFALLAVAFAMLASVPTYAAGFAFPVIGNSSFSNDFNAPRSNGTHHAIDIIADKRQKIVSRTDGTISFVAYPQPSWGFAVFVRADNGYEYWYLHINNDTPGTDDGKADPYYAYGPDVQVGNRVIAGQLLGYVGDSGNAENTVSHLHFEVLRSDDSRVNPYDGLVNNSYYLKQPRLNYPRVGSEILPSSTSFTGGYRLASGHVQAADTNDTIVGSGAGGKKVKILNESGTSIAEFQPNGSDFLGGVDVAAGDVDNDGVDEIITGPGKGGRYVKIFEKDGTLIQRFQPNGSDFLGGVDVAAGDVDNDGVDEIITGPGKGGRYVKIFEKDGTLIQRFAPYSSAVGVNVSSGNFDGDAADEIVTSAPPGGGPRINIYDNNGTLLDSRYVFSSTFKGGIRTTTGDIDPSSPYDEVIAISQEDGAPRAKVLSASGETIGVTSDFAESWWNGYYDLTVSESGDILASMGINRRSTIRNVPFN